MAVEPARASPAPANGGLAAAELSELAKLFNARRFREMENAARSLTLRLPASGAAWKALGTAQQVQRKNAVQALEKAAQLLPDDAEVFNNLAAALLDQQRADEAEAAAVHALAIKPDFAEAHANLGKSLLQRGRSEEAIASYRRAIDIRPGFATAHSSLGIAFNELGDFAAAAAAFESALTCDPGLVEAHYGLSQIKTYRASDPHLAMLEQQIATVETLPMESQLRFWFALGKVCEDIGNYDNAFAAYRAGNHLKRATLVVNEVGEDALVQRIIGTFSPDFFAQQRVATSSAPHGPTPIFIIGMPRSGSTLLEQILASCEGVHGAGELTHLSDIAEQYFRPRGKPFPLAVTELSAMELQDMGLQYLERISRHAPEANFVTDKMPANFFYVGLIHLMLPGAKIIHAMRDPMDSCFSCYARLFSGDKQAFSYDLDSLGRYYARYAETMKHWHAVLPAGSILDLRYEELVRDTEGQARRLLSWLGLPWDAQCLEFHRNKRRVLTASAAQVQKPIYRSSLARWENFARHLMPLSKWVEPYRNTAA